MLTLGNTGCGFWDEGTDEGDRFNELLTEFAGRHLFEELDSMLYVTPCHCKMLHDPAVCKGGTIDLAILPEFIAEYRDKYFKSHRHGTSQTPGDAGGTESQSEPT